MLLFFTVSYYPDSNLVTNVECAIAAGISVFIYNNGMSSEIKGQLSSLPVNILGTGKNDGLGIAFATFEDCYLSQSDFYLYLDQDSLLGMEDWVLLAKHHKNVFSKKNVGMCHISKSMPRSSILPNSGSLFSGFITHNFVSHDPSFFVECVDYDYCYRLFCNNLSVTSFPLKSFDHSTLQEGKIISLFGLDVSLRSYSSRRVKDFTLSHIRLIIRCILSLHIPYALYFFRSFILWNFKNILSRVLFSTVLSVLSRRP